MIRKALGPKASEKRKKTVLTKRKYKMRVLAQPVPTIPTTPVNSTAPAPTVATTSTQMPVTRSATTSILVMVYKLVTGQFVEDPYLTPRPQNEGHSLTQTPTLCHWKTYPVPQLDRVPLGSNMGSASENLFETREDWWIPPTPVPTPAPTIKREVPSQVAAIPYVMVRPKQAAEGCS